MDHDQRSAETAGIDGEVAVGAVADMIGWMIGTLHAWLLN